MIVSQFFTFAKLAMFPMIDKQSSLDSHLHSLSGHPTASHWQSSCLSSHSEKSLDDAITNILKFDRPKKTVISIFISGLKESIYENLAVKSTEKNTSLDEFTKQILSKQLPENSVTSVKTRKNLIRIVFSENGKKEFNNLIVSKSISKNDIINYIFQAEGF